MSLISNVHTREIFFIEALAKEGSSKCSHKRDILSALRALEKEGLLNAQTSLRGFLGR